MTPSAQQLLATARNDKSITFKGITLFCGVEPKDAVGRSREVTGSERDEILTYITLKDEQEMPYQTNIMEIHRIGEKIYSISYYNQSEPFVEELQPFK
jgi:hypothetical protein